MNRGAGRMEFAAERVARTVLSVIGFAMGVGGGADILEIRFDQRVFVSRKRTGRACRCLASAEENDCDEGRENGQGEAAKFCVGQGDRRRLINTYSQPRK